MGKYVRRCIIIYEKTPFDKLVTLCKQSAPQFKNLTYLITKHIGLLNSANKDEHTNCNLNQTGKTAGYKTALITMIDKDQETQTFEIDNSNSPTTGTLFTNDESNITLASEWMNRSSHADCSVMDLEPLEESLNQTGHSVAAPTINANAVASTATVPKFPKNSKFDLKTLTSTVSAQRTHSFKSLAAASTLHGDLVEPIRKSHHPTVTFQLPASQADRGLDNSLVCPSERPGTSGNDKFKPLSEFLEPSASTLAGDSPFGCANIASSFEFSRKIAEYFVAKQAFLIENNEHEALSPIELLAKIDELISYDSTFSEAYYLRYLNYLRLKDYPMALKALHDYFDRLLLAGSVSLAALNLCSLEYRFDNK